DIDVRIGAWMPIYRLASVRRDIESATGKIDRQAHELIHRVQRGEGREGNRSTYSILCDHLACHQKEEACDQPRGQVGKCPVNIGILLDVVWRDGEHGPGPHVSASFPKSSLGALGLSRQIDPCGIRVHTAY